MSLAQLAREYNYVKPELTEDNVIYIKNGRYNIYLTIPTCT